MSYVLFTLCTHCRIQTLKLITYSGVYGLLYIFLCVSKPIWFWKKKLKKYFEFLLCTDSYVILTSNKFVPENHNNNRYFFFVPNESWSFFSSFAAVQRDRTAFFIRPLVPTKLLRTLWRFEPYKYNTYIYRYEPKTNRTPRSARSANIDVV